MERLARGCADSRDGIPSALRFVPLVGVVVWVLAAGYAVAYVLAR